MSTAAKFSNNVEISGNVDISGNINLNGTLTVDGSFSLYGYHIPDPSGEYNKVLTISGDGYSWETVQSGSAGDEEINAAGQTFYEIITEQPRAFDISLIDGASFANTFNTIDIAWNFDNLIPKDENGQQQILNITENLNQRVLPCITDIYFEISSNEAPSTIIATESISVTSSHNYNSDSYESKGSFSKNTTSMSYTLTYKTLNLSISIQDTNSYTVSIYGQNSSNGSDVNKLTYTGLVFQATGIPEVPTITSITDSISGNTISFTINATTTDMDEDTDNTVLSSALYISQLDLSHTLIDSVRSGSTGYGIPSHSASDDETSITYANNISGGTDSFGNESISISPTYSSANGNFYLGSKYTMQARIYNLLNSNPTDYSDSVETDYSDIPTSSNKDTNNPFNGAPSLEQSSSKALLDYATDNVYNLSNLNTNARINPSTTGTRYVQISDPNSDISYTSGYGKYIDGSKNLIYINCLLYFNGTDVSLQQVDFHGWDASYTSGVSNSNIVPFQSLNVSDMYSSNQQKGFRRLAHFDTSNVLYIDDLYTQGFIQPFIPYNVSSGYKVQYNLTRTDGYSGAGSNDTRTSSDFYVDNFPNYNQLSLDDWTGSVTVTDVSWVMGIPNVSKITIDLSSNHYNINSEYLYFRNDEQIAQMLNLWMGDGTNSQVYDLDTFGNAFYLTLDSSSNIDSSGTYYGTYSKTLDYTANKSSSFSNNTVTGLTLTSKLYNLYTDSTIDKVISFTHYRDVTSISNYSSVFKGNIYEINDSCYNYLGNDGSKPFLSLHDNETGLINYTDDAKEIESATSAFINGYFTANISEYPDINNFNYDNALNSYSYNNYIYTNKDDGLNIGTATVEASNGTRYKAIVYKVITDTTDSSYDSSEFMNTGASTLSVINLSVIIDKLFGATILSSVTSAMLSDTTFSDDLLIYSVANATQSNGSNVPCVGIINDGKFTNFIDLATAPWFTQNTATSTKSFDDLTGFNSTTGQSSGGALISRGTEPNREYCCNNAGFGTTYTASDGNSYSTFVGHANRDIATLNKYYLYFFLKIS